MQGFVDGLQLELHATYLAQDVYRSALASVPDRHSFASCDSVGSPAPPHSKSKAVTCRAHSALRADSSTLTPGSGAGPWRACGVRAPFDHFPLVIDHPIGRVPDAPHLHLCTTVGTAEGIAPRALLVPLPVR